MTTDISLRNKILLSFLGLLVVLSLTTITAVLFATNNSVEDRAREKLVVGSKVFEQLLDMRAGQLFDSAELLTSDFGFKSAVLDNDESTIISVLNNHGARIGADMMMLVSVDGDFIASSDQRYYHENLPFKALTPVAEQQGGLARTVIISGQIYQVLMLPIKAPVISAWAVVGFRIDESLANQLKDLTNLEVTFTGVDTVNERLTLTTLSNNSLPESMGQTRTRGPRENNAWELATFGQDDYLSTTMNLVQEPNYHVDAVLSASLSQEYAKFYELKIQMLVIAAVALVMSVLLAFFIASNVTRPLSMLATAATRISRGDYSGEIDIDGQQRNEIGKLASSLNHMQKGIAEREDQMLYQAYHDDLTGLYNRISLRETIDNLIAQNGQTQRSFALAHLNIRYFKQVNDTFGYQAGDRLLVAVSQRMSNLVGEKDTVARIGADEFVLVLFDEDEASMEGRMNALLEAVSGAYQIGELSISAAFTAGISLFPAHGKRTDQLLRMADIALNQARTSKQAFWFYTPGADEKHLKQIRLVNDLKQAIASDGLTMFYQPKLDLKQKKVTQVEALVRWIHAEYGFVSPGEFIGLAEQSGLMPELTRWVICFVLKEVSEWKAQGIDIQVAINLSAHDLLDETLPDYVKCLLKECDLPTSALILEVTESAMMENPQKALSILNRFKADGIVLAVDDYGTGYSSLSQLKELPVDELKIDMSFVLKLDQSNFDQAIVQSTIKMGHKLGLTIVAEGVENRASWALLEEWGCDKLQGYYISKPQNGSDFLQWYKEYDIKTEYPDIELKHNQSV